MTRLKHIFLLLLLGVGIYLPVISAIHPPKAAALTVNPVDGSSSGASGSWWSQADINERVMAYLYINGFAGCIQNKSTAGARQEISRVADYEFFNSSNVGIGGIVSNVSNGESDGGDETLSCHGDEGKKWVKDATDLFDSTGLITQQAGAAGPISAACWLGWTRVNNHSQSVQDCVNGKEKTLFIYSLFDRFGTNRSDADSFKSEITKKLSGTATTSAYTLLGAPERYYLLSQSFITSCQATKGGLYGSDQAIKTKVDNGDGNYYKLKVPNADGSVDVYVYTSDTGRDKHQTISIKSDYHLWNPTCAGIVTEANKYAQTTADYMKLSGNTDAVSQIEDSNPDGDTPDIKCGASVGSFFKGIPIISGTLNWLACGLISGMIQLAGALENQIVDMLCINTGDVFGAQGATTCGSASGDSADTSLAYKRAWDVFRIISLGLLVIAALVMILSQTSGFDFVDAYTIRKTLPRVLVAAIGISLSWALLEFFVGLSNDLGVGVRGLIYAPFSSVTNDAVLGGGSSALTAMFATGYLVSLGAVGTLLLIASGLLAVMIAFAVLIIRNILVVMLLITAPIAIAAYVLPNTQKVWKIWWDFLSKALMVFPIITGFIAIGHVFGALAIQSGGVANQLIGIVAYFIPYFLLPATFRFAGGAIATIGGFTNDRSRGAFDRLKKGRQGIQANRYQRAVNGKLWDPDSRIQKALRGNKFAENIAAPHKGAAYALRHNNVPVLSRYGRRLESSVHAAKMEQSQKWFEHVNKHGANDKFFSAVGGMYDAFEKDETVRKGLLEAGFAKEGKDGRLIATRSLRSEQDFHKMADILSKSSSDSNQKAAFALRSNASYTAEAFRDPEMNYVDTAVGASLGRAAHGFLTAQDSADNENLIAKENGGDIDFAHAAAVQAQAVGGRSNPDNKAGYGTHYDPEAYNEQTGGKGAYVTAYESDRAWEVLKTIKPGDYAQAKGNVFKDERMGGIFADTLAIQRGGDDAQAVVQKWKDAGVSDKEIASRIDTAHTSAAAVEDTLLQVAGQYSGTDPTAKKMAIDIIEKASGGRKVLERPARDVAGKTIKDTSSPTGYKMEQYEGYEPGSLAARLETYRTRASDPATRGGGGAPEPPDEAGGAGGPGGGGA